MVSLAKGIFIISAKRTPFGAFGGKLVDKTCVDMQEHASKAALAAAKIDPSLIDSVVIGNVISSSSPDAAYISRHVSLRCGIPIERGALTVNRLCGSGFQSIVNAAQEISIGESNIVLTGGSDSMSQAPFAVRGVRFGTRLGAPYNLEDCLWVSLTDQHCKTPMGVTAENLAEKYNLTRDDSDQFSLRSQQNWFKANEAGYFKAEIAPMKLKIKGKEVEMTEDEHPKPKTTLEGLAKLPTVFKKNGTVTAGSASGICDGAGSVIVASEDAIKQHKLKPLARVVGYAVAGVEPTIMGIGPVSAITKVLKATNLTLNQIDLIEINEAFSSQVLACRKELGIDLEKLNQNGGAIALGHPLAASGSRITAHLTHELIRQNKKYAIGSACIGGGQGIALLLERV
ncbi:3-ketoacyl-CoA thiolase, mitochondrial [Folsomia candida]|uniref:Mitochondrial 3-ketoacyl-coa thiolase n=1 Tax=Folsomia candida TaxID=158441 RepID=A0A481SYW6_FOLCA|nr:3-ketoacyl-CoA thiolase, mitochondrial [Folsomia candida]QBH73970.1 mitochondrial 3-ketoacyl-coa thiolase [Folsomia candida]